MVVGMEYDSGPQKRMMKHKGKNVVWSIAMDKCLIETLAFQARNGNKVERCFNETAYTAACHAVNACFNLSQAPSQWSGMVQNGEPPTEFTRPGDSDSASFASQSSEEMAMGDTDGTETESSTGLPQYNSNLPGGAPTRVPPVHPLRQPSKHHWSRSEEPLQDALLAVATSIRHLADSLERSKNPVDASKLLEAVMEIENLEEARKMYAFEYLNADSIKARAFMAYCPRMRRIYLFRQFWWWK